MFRQRFRIGRAMRNAVAWLGLLLLVSSFVWMELVPKPEAATATALVRPPSARAPFAVVVLDPGHGGQDSGAMCAGVLEKDLTLDIARRVDRLLQAEGLATAMTRLGDSYVSLADRAAFANRVHDCIFVSIHFNEGNKKEQISSGVETFYAAHQVTPASLMISWIPFLQRAVSELPNVESQSLAGFVQEALVARTQAVNRGTKAEQFFVLANVNRPSVLVEGGFLSNKEDISKIANSDYREQMAAAISEGILRYRDALKERQQPLALGVPRSE
jgi:N-acetylmuramoyl-L-alanine amidase